MTTITIH